MKTNHRKLTLNKETLRSLSEDTMSAVNGGGSKWICIGATFFNFCANTKRKCITNDDSVYAPIVATDARSGCDVC